MSQYPKTFQNKVEVLIEAARIWDDLEQRSCKHETLSFLEGGVFCTKCKKELTTEEIHFIYKNYEKRNA